VQQEPEIKDERDGDPSLTMRVAAEPRASRAVRDAVATFGRRIGVEESDLDVLLTAIGEAVANAIEHSGTVEPIEVSCVARDDQILVAVRDFGRGLSEAAIATDIPPVHRERGRGWPIMRTCSDVFSVRSMPGAGTLVVVGRYLRLSNEPSSARRHLSSVSGANRNGTRPAQP
jgi:anti-sigma regulatory factor (Ser/Thr protein kinase)